MKLYRIHEVPPSPLAEVVFKQSVMGKFWAFILTLAMSAVLVWFGLRGGYDSTNVHLPPFLLYWIGAVIGLLALFIFSYARAAMRPSNWLVKFNKERVLIKFRSHLNDHFPAEDPIVISFLPSEIQWIRKHKETQSSPNANKASTAERLSFWTFLEMKLGVHAEMRELEAALLAERNRKAPKIGRTRSKHNHYPVRLLDSGILRLEWNGIKPGVDKALKILGHVLQQRPEIHSRAKHWNELQAKEVDDRILDLAERGKTIEAVTMVRMKYDIGLAEAKIFVDELMERKTPLG